MADGAAWTDGELRRQLVALDLPSEVVVVVPIRVTGADLDPGRTRRNAGNRRMWLVAVVVLIVAAIVGAALLQALREGLTNGTVLLVLLLGGQGAIRWWGSPTIRGPVVPRSQAAGFVDSLLKPTAVVRTVKRRWLVLAAADQQLVVTQEQRWTVGGPQQCAELRWSDADGRMVAATSVPSHFRSWMRLEFADHSTVEVQLTKVAARALAAAVPQTTSPASDS